MKDESKRAQQIWGGFFIALALLLYAFLFVGLPVKPIKAKQLQPPWLQKIQSKFDPTWIKAVPSTSPTAPIIDRVINPLPVCLLFVGVAWLFNAKRKVGVWSYRILAGYFIVMAGLALTSWNIARASHSAKSSYQMALLIATVVFVGAGALVYSRSRKLAEQTKPSEDAQAPVEKAEEAPTVVRIKRARAAGPKSYQFCNVLRMGADKREVWQFEARGGDFVLDREQAATGEEKLPSSVITKTWRSLWQRKLNIAWLPPESVFLRVAQLPKSSFEETLSMVELQLEKYSPIPVTQALWSIHPLPQAEGDLQSVVILFAERKAVEEFLGQLEGQGYLADRLEIPALDQLQAMEVTEDGAWIFPEAIGGHRNALVAWWSGGVLQNLNLLALPTTGDAAAAVKAQLAQVAWAGELEGWLTAPPTWHLVADETLAAEWEPALRQGLEEPIQVVPPPRPSELAGLTAKRATASNGVSNLLPEEFIKRYQAQFQDRLWLRGLAAIVALYLMGVAVYFLALAVLFMQTRSVENKVTVLSNSYTNVVQLKERYRVLKDRQDLKYAALDCWKAVADVLPNELTLDGFNFSDGRKLTLNGTAGDGQTKAVIDFNEAIRNAVANGQPLFDKTKGDPLNYRVAPGGGVSWNFSLELKRTEVQ